MKELIQEALEHIFEDNKWQLEISDISEYIDSTDLSDVGFMIEFKKVDKLVVFDNRESFTGGDIGMKLNGNIDVGFVVYVEEGYLSALECYTYGTELPREIVSFKPYKMNLT
jgi:hypothetical protein